MFQQWRRTRIRPAFPEEAAPFKARGATRVFYLVPRHYCQHRRRGRPEVHQRLWCLCTGTLIVVWDGYQTGRAIPRGRYYVTCDKHRTVTHYGRAAAIAAAKDASFCTECRREFLQTSPCNLCGAKTRGCAMCLEK